ncbi:MAG: helix-turn-helix domain-containing protein [Cellulosilyticum sp.]|nr:helix-turn-helix domain-containing protein [Cellulosilyticum sp.]
MEESIYLNPIRPQPFDGGIGTSYDGLHEFVDYLPGTSIRFWYTSDSNCYTEHWHDSMEIISCERGYYLSDIEGVNFKVTPGDILMIPGGIIHTLSPMDDCHGYVHLIDLHFIKELKSSDSIHPILSHPIFISQKERHSLNLSVGSLLEQMRNEYFSDNNLRELLIYSHMLLLLAHVVQEHFTSARNSLRLHTTRQKEYIDKFNEVLKYLSLHYMEDLTLEQTAKHFGFSKYHFSRLFSKYTTYNFSDYLTYQRINTAQSLLMQSSLSITEIAEQSGFNSLSTFNRVFKEKIGCSPSKYRNLYTQI